MAEIEVFPTENSAIDRQLSILARVIRERVGDRNDQAIVIMDTSNPIPTQEFREKLETALYVGFTVQTDLLDPDEVGIANYFGVLADSELELTNLHYQRNHVRRVSSLQLYDPKKNYFN